MKYYKDFKKLCTPASVYLFVNVIIFISIAIQNFGNTRQYCVGQYKCNVPNTFSMFLFKAIYILFWTFVLNAICKAGYKEISWFMVLLPIILLFIILGMILLNSGNVRLYEGFKEGNTEGNSEGNSEPTTESSETARHEEDNSLSNSNEEESDEEVTETNGSSKNNIKKKKDTKETEAFKNMFR